MFPYSRLGVCSKSLFRSEELNFCAKNVKAEEGYPEGNLTRREHFVARNSILQQKMEILSRLRIEAKKNDQSRHDLLVVSHFWGRKDLES